MAHDTYGYEELMALVDNTKPQPFFMLEQFVTNSFVSRADKISFDEVFNDVRIAPFVSPVSDGDSVIHGGYTVRDFSPAYIKLDDPITIQQISNRVAGQALNTAIDRLSNLEQAIVMRLAQHRRSILTRLEWMAWQYARTGGYAVSGPKYPTVNLSFGRNAGNTVALAGADLWSAPTTATPLDDFQDWSSVMMLAPRGLVGVNVIMRSTVWNNLIKTAQFKEAFNIFKPTGGVLPNISPTLANYVSYKGEYGQYRIWVVDTTYLDATGTQQYFLPNNEVIMTAVPGDEMGLTKAFGKIESLKAVREGDPMIDIWHNHYITDDGDSECIKTHCAPLIVGKRVDSFLKATVQA